MKTELASVKTDVQTVKTELADVKTDVQAVKTELAGVKSDMRWLKWLAGAGVAGILIPLLRDLFGALP